MQPINLDFEHSEAVVGWNTNGLAGYVIHRGKLWSAVTCSEPEPVTHVFRRGASALRWLHQTGDADYFESLSDRSDLRHLIGQPTDDSHPERSLRTTARDCSKDVADRHQPDHKPSTEVNHADV